MSFLLTDQHLGTEVLLSSLTPEYLTRLECMCAAYQAMQSSMHVLLLWLLPNKRTVKYSLTRHPHSILQHQSVLTPLPLYDSKTASEMVLSLYCEV